MNVREIEVGASAQSRVPPSPDPLKALNTHYVCKIPWLKLVLKRPRPAK